MSPANVAIGADGEPMLGAAGGRWTSSGTLVNEWKAFLLAAKFLTAGSMAGPWTNATTSATQAFQRAAGITADGVVGPQTRGAARSWGFRGGGAIRQAGSPGVTDIPVLDDFLKTSPDIGPIISYSADAFPPPGQSLPATPVPIEGNMLDTSEVPASTSFFAAPAWSGGPTRGQVAGATGVVGGLLLLGGVLIKALRSAPATGMAAMEPDYHRPCCG